MLRKQRLIFLHWYHHVTVLLYTWYSYKDQVGGGAWFGTVNLCVHAFMYSYYAARAAGYRVPRPLAMFITAAQISQMAVGMTVTALVWRWTPSHGDSSGSGDCPSYPNNIAWAMLMYFSYLLLFLHFFYHAYVRKDGARIGAEHKAVKTD